MKVMARACDECLFSKNRIVSGARAAQIISSTRQRNNHFICHKSEPGDEITCHEHHALGIGQMSRIAERLGMVTWIEPTTLAAVPSASPTPEDQATVSPPAEAQDSP